MNFKKIVAAIAATAVASSAFVFSASALVTKIDTIKLNSGSDAEKTVQYDMSAFGVDAIDTMTLIGVASVGDGWIGGGGAIGFDSVDGWLQIDFALDSEGVTVNDKTGEMTAVIDFTKLGKNTAINFEKEDGLCQIGWWWGSGDGTLELSDIQVNGTSVIGNEAAAPAEEVVADEEDAAEADEDDAAEEDETVEEVEDVAAPAEDPNALPFNLSGGQYTYDFILNGTDYENTKTITFTLETASDGDFGGGVMFNGTACGWSQSEENFYSGPEGDKDLKCTKIDDCKYELTVEIPDGIFGAYTDEDFYAQVVVQKWWGDDPIAITAVELDKVLERGDIIEEEPVIEAGDVDGAVEETKGSPDTGVADVAAVAGLALVAGAAFVVAKKRK